MSKIVVGGNMLKMHMVKMITIKNSLQLVASIKVSRLTIWNKVLIELLLFDQVAIFMWKIFPLIYYNV